MAKGLEKEYLEEVTNYLDSDVATGDVIRCLVCGDVSLHQNGGTCCGTCEEEDFEVIEENVSLDFLKEKGYILIDL